MPNAKVFYSPSGDKIREKFQWNADKTALVKVGEVDIQKDINEKAKGLKISEQVARIARGELGVVMEGEGYYGDVSGMSEQTVGQQLGVMENKTVEQFAKNQIHKNSENESELEKAKKALAEAQAKLDALQGGNQ